MTPRMGRPLKGNTVKNVSLQLRISQETADKLQECSKIMNISRTEVIEQGVDIIHNQVAKKK